MKKVYKACPICNGKGIVPFTCYDSSPGTICTPQVVETCKNCEGRGHLDEVLYFIEEDIPEVIIPQEGRIELTGYIKSSTAFEFVN